jgi:hypothetical protein
MFFAQFQIEFFGRIMGFGIEKSFEDQHSLTGIFQSFLPQIGVENGCTIHRRIPRGRN